MEQIPSSLWSLQRNRRSHNDALRKHESKVRDPDVDSDFFDIVAGVLQGDTLSPYLFIIWLDYVLWTSINLMKENGFTLETEYMSFNQNQSGDIATVKGCSLKLVDKFTYLGSSISSTENDIYMRLAKACQLSIGY